MSKAFETADKLGFEYCPNSGWDYKLIEKEVNGVTYYSWTTIYFGVDEFEVRFYPWDEDRACDRNPYHVYTASYTAHAVYKLLKLLS